MTTISSKVAVLVLGLTAGHFQLAFADDDNNHFPSLKSSDITQALCRLITHNDKLQLILDKESLSPLDMVKVHELTYTLENAIMRLQQDLATIAVDLETVHKASESLSETVIKDKGTDYINATTQLIKPPKCEN